MIKNILFVFCMMCVIFCPVQGFAQGEATARFYEAGELYKKGDYTQAIGIYESILDSDKASGALYFNLANSYFRNRQKGLAVLNYERALRLIPRDSDVKFNYYYLRGLTGNSTQAPKGIMISLLHEHIRFYTINEMVMIIVALVFLLGIVFLLSLYLRWPARVKRGLTTGIAILIMIYVAGLILKAHHDKDRAIVTTSAKSYFEPRSDSTIHFSLKEGVSVKILKVQDDWLKIKRLDGKLGWVAQGSVAQIKIK